MFRYFTLLIALLIFGCSTDALDLEGTLQESLASKKVVIDNVIACAANNENDDLISVFFYPRPGVSNIRYYETLNATIDKNDFANYTQVEFPLLDVFNGFLKKFEISSDTEKWVIIAFDELGQTHLSNPIRLKHQTKPTEYLPQIITVDATTDMPLFSWQEGSYLDTAIYFQVISDDQNNLLSGTYTYETEFQYYQLDNVVLNITKGTPPVLKSGDSHHFTLMGVSEDNWVNLFSELPFEVLE